jgi:hypothetical protein
MGEAVLLTPYFLRPYHAKRISGYEKMNSTTDCRDPEQLEKMVS